MRMPSLRKLLSCTARPWLSFYPPLSVSYIFLTEPFLWKEPNHGILLTFDIFVNLTKSTQLQLEKKKSSKVFNWRNHRNITDTDYSLALEVIALNNRRLYWEKGSGYFKLSLAQFYVKKAKNRRSKYLTFVHCITLHVCLFLVVWFLSSGWYLPSLRRRQCRQHGIWCLAFLFERSAKREWLVDESQGTMGRWKKTGRFLLPTLLSARTG